MKRALSYAKQLFPGLVYLSLLAALGCASGAYPPYSNPDQVDSRLWEHYKVYHLKVEGENAVKTHIGACERQIDAGDEEFFWVLDIRHRRRGVIFPNGMSFRLVEEPDDEGNRLKELGNHGREGGVQRILGISEGTIELEKVSSKDLE